MISAPNEIFPDVRIPRSQNQKNIPFAPKSYNKKGILWWHVPEFLEENKDNKPIHDLTDGMNFWQVRRNILTGIYDKDVYPLIDAKYQSDLWERGSKSAVKQGYLEEKERYELFDKINYLADAACHGRMGNHISGLYLDFNELEKIFSLPVKEAVRIVDNNLFVGNMATFYSAAVENKEPQEICEKLKKQYKKALNLASRPDVHLIPQTQPQIILNNRMAALKPKSKLEYNDLLAKEQKTLNKYQDFAF